MPKLLHFVVFKTVFLLGIGSISSLKNDTKILSVNKSESLMKGPNYKCSKYFYQIQQELAAIIPPLDSLKDNYHSIYQALYPSNNLPSLYVKVTIKFLLDYQNGTKTIDQTRTKKMTWSQSCIFVSVDGISLTAMSFFSLGTILPQRRQSELTVTVSPVCPNSTLQEDDNLWRNVVFMLQDIAVIANLSDPQLNTAQCVVNGQENSSQKIVCPYTSIFQRKVLWNIAYWVLGTAIVLSLVVWYYLHSLLLHHLTRLNNTINSGQDIITTARQAVPIGGRVVQLVVQLVVQSENRSGENVGLLELTERAGSQNIQSHTKNTLKIYLGVSFKMIWFMSVLTLLSFVLGSYFSECCYRWIYIGFYLLAFVIIVFYLCFKGCCECGKQCKCTTTHPLCLLFPNVFQTVHHLLWVVCGIVTDPSWATPIVLLEGLAMLSLVYAIYLYQRDVVEDDTNWGACDKFQIIAHLCFTLISFWAVLFIVAVIGYAGIVNVPSAGVIEVIATAIFVWLVKMAGIQLNPGK